MSHEQTITVQVDGKWWNIPTVVDGKKLSEKEATDHALKTKRNFGSFGSLSEAETAAQQRSASFDGGHMAAPNAPMTQPQGGVTPQAAPKPGFDELKSQWTNFFSRPDVISGLLQFGGTMLTPGSSVGLALTEAAQAAGTTNALIQERQDTAANRELASRRVATEERGAATQEERNRLAAEELKQTGAFKTRELDIEKQRADAYTRLAQAGGGGSRLSVKDRIAKTAFDAFLETAYSMEEFDDDPEGAVNWALDQLAGWYARGEGSGLPGEGGAPTTPPPGGGAAPPTGQEGASSPPAAPAPTADVTTGLPPLETLSLEQLEAIVANPELLTEADAGYGQGNVKAMLKRKRRDKWLTESGPTGAAPVQQ